MRRRGVETKGSAGLDEDAEGAPEMVGMGEGLKLPGVTGGPATGAAEVVPGVFGNGSEEGGLGLKGFGFQAGGFTGGLDAGEVDVGGEVLPARVGEEVGTLVMAMVGAQGAVLSFGGEEVFGGEAVIQSEEAARFEDSSGLAPPGFRGGTNLGGEGVGEDVEESGRERRVEAGRVSGFGEARPGEVVALDGDAPLEPGAPIRVPAEPVDGHGVEEFVREDGAADFGAGGIADVRKAAGPADLGRIGAQGFALPRLTAGGGFDDPVLNARGQVRSPVVERGEDIAGEGAVVGAGFDEEERAGGGGVVEGGERGQPGGKLGGEQFPEEAADGDAGVVIAAAAEGVIFLFIKSTNGTIEGEFHEARERNNAALGDFSPDYFNGGAQKSHALRCGADLANHGLTAEYLWRKLMHSST